MPQAIPALIAIGYTAITATIINTVLINVALGYLAKALAGSPRQSRPPVNVTVRNSVEARRVVLGTRRAGGTFVYYALGVDKRTLWYVIVYTGHQVSAIKDIWIDNDKIPDADINPSTGAVSTTNFAGKLNIWRYLGTSAQTVDTNLNSALGGVWTSSHKLQGCSYAVLKMIRDDTAFPSGAPQSVTALVDGALLYDPRLDSTNGGSGSHRASDPSTWAFSSNPALAWRWVTSGGSVHNDTSTRLIKYGLREIDSRIPDAYTIAAANICDQSVSGANAPPSGAQKRYECNIELSCDENRRDWLEAILATMAGTVAYVHGQHRVYAGAYDSPIHTFTQDDLYGDLEIQDTTPHADRYNATCATFVDKTAGYVEQTTIFRTNSSYETQDGGERIEHEIDLRGVTDQYQAQRLCEIENRKSRQQRVIKKPGALNLLKCAQGETFTYTHTRLGWSKIFQCIERQFESTEGAGQVSITAREVSSTVYTDLITADYTTGTSSSDSFEKELPEAPTALTASNAYSLAIDFSWTVGTFWQINGIVELWEYTASTPFASATLIWYGRGSGVRIRKTDTTTRYYWIRVRSLGGAVGAEYPTSAAGVSAAAQFIRNPDIDPDAVTKTYDSSTSSFSGSGSASDSGPSFTAPYAGRVVLTVFGRFYGNTSGVDTSTTPDTITIGISGTTAVTTCPPTNSDSPYVTIQVEKTVALGDSVTTSCNLSTNGTGTRLLVGNDLRYHVELIGK